MAGADKPGSKDLTRVCRFLEVLAGTRILSAESLAEIEQAWKNRGDDDSQLLAKELVQREKLTRYQAAAIYQGKTRGLVLNDYVVIDKLGSGGMGNVFKARHRTDGSAVAIKVMSSASTRSADNVKRFQREAEMAARLNHPNIVRAIESGSADGLSYFVMEFVAGIDLSTYLKQRGPIPHEQAIQCVLQAAQGLDFAHSQGIVHRDIKPGNLFLCENGIVKLLDMGLARLNDPSDGAAAQAQEGLTQTGQVMGTVDYMAPEQALNTRNADARADIYSLGCTLYRLITGNIPFEGDSVVEKILAHREQPIPSVRTKFPEIPLGVDFVLSRMLAKRPSDRYQTIREVVQALQSAPQLTAAPSELPMPSGPTIQGATPLAIALPIPTALSTAAESSNSFSLGVSVSPVVREPGSHPSVAALSRHAPLMWGALAATVMAMVGVIGYPLLQPPSDVVVENNSQSGDVQAIKESPSVVEPPAAKKLPDETKTAASQPAMVPSVASEKDLKSESPNVPPANTSNVTDSKSAPALSPPPTTSVTTNSSSASSASDNNVSDPKKRMSKRSAS
ncbi:MAG: protein kinase [Planctomycetaceae bacterium]|nr:protein kinase [Planctomycetaceae bacterium]